MKKRKRNARMGRPPVPVDKVRPHRYTVSLTHRDQYLLEKYHKDRPHLTRASCIRELAHFMLEIMEDEQAGVTHLIAEGVYSEGVAADKSQVEIDFTTSAIQRNVIDILRDPKMEKRLMKGLHKPNLPKR